MLTVLDLNDQPLANSYLKQQTEPEERYPLALNYCPQCTHLQLSNAVDPDLLFKNYLYVSGTTQTLRDYFDSFVDLTKQYITRNERLNVLDIACNDGSQLDSFRRQGHNTFGIDPAENLFPTSSVNHNICCDYLTPTSIASFGVKFDVIIAQNVFAHNTYPREFLEICKQHLSENGKIFIQTSQANLVENGEFDTIYHEHISFFSTRSMATLVQQAGLQLLDVQKTPIHGTSYVFVIGADASSDRSSLFMVDNNVETTRTTDSIQQFANSARNTVLALKQGIERFASQGIPVIGYGAAAKGNTVLNFGEIQLDYIVDDNPLKQDLYAPGCRIKIISLDTMNSMYADRPVVWIPLAWNFFDEIRARVNRVRKTKDVYIRYFPRYVEE